MLAVGALVGLYLTQMNQDLRQQASSDYTCPSRAGETQFYCNGCGGFCLTIEEMNQGGGCDLAIRNRCGEPIVRGGVGDYCDSSGCTAPSGCMVNRYHCDRNTNFGGGCQDTLTGSSVGGRMRFTASCGMEQIDVECPDGTRDFTSNLYTNACGSGGGGGGGGEEEEMVCGERGCNSNSDCAGSLQCITANNGSKYCANPAYRTACSANPSQQSCCTEPRTSLVCGQQGCNANSDCSSGLSCITANNGSRYCANPAYRTACSANPSQQNCCQAQQTTLTCGEQGCNSNADCTSGLSCITADNGNKYCANPEYQSACSADPTETNCCTEQTVGPQCLEIKMFTVNNGTSSLATEDDDENFVPGETTVRFVCGNTQGEPLPSGYSYRFRIYEPCGSDNHTTPLELDADTGGNGVNYDLELAGEYAAQCAVCSDVDGDTVCDFEAYSPLACED